MNYEDLYSIIISEPIYLTLVIIFILIIIYSILKKFFKLLIIVFISLVIYISFLIYTDGVTEGYIDKDKELTVPGLENQIKNLNSNEPKIIIDKINSILTEKKLNLRDDITTLGIKI